MPTQTFFRLYEEKKNRFIEAAWREFTAYSFADASINRIVRDARIPRGSFYQYFEDKEDLFFYLLGTIREEALWLMTDSLKKTGGEPFEASLILFDAIFLGNGEIRESMRRVIDVLRKNQNMDMSQMVLDRMQGDTGVNGVLNKIKCDNFLRTGPEYLHNVAALMIFSFACTLRNILCGGADVGEEREKLCSQLEIIRRGCTKQEVAS